MHVNFLKTNESQDIYFLVISRFQKVFLHNKIINKVEKTKNQENSAQLFEENYLTDHFAKLLQDRIKP